MVYGAWCLTPLSTIFQWYRMIIGYPMAIKRFFFKCTYPIPINIIIDSAKPNELFTAKFSAIGIFVGKKFNSTIPNNVPLMSNNKYGLSWNQDDQNERSEISAYGRFSESKKYNINQTLRALCCTKKTLS